LLHNFRLKVGLVFAVALLSTALIAPGSASARCTTGGMSPAEIDVCTPTAKAKLLDNGMLIPPKSAPLAVKQVIAAANKIRSKPYVWGGGHGRWWDRGYDCSGAVSYVLHGAGLLSSPLDSTGFMSWGAPGPGKHITIYANSGHVFMTIDGRRFDTGYGGEGNRWASGSRPTAGFVVRHPPGY
jgi:hypothetical protein